MRGLHGNGMESPRRLIGSARPPAPGPHPRIIVYLGIDRFVRLPSKHAYQTQRAPFMNRETLDFLLSSAAARSGYGLNEIRVKRDVVFGIRAVVEAKEDRL